MDNVLVHRHYRKELHYRVELDSTPSITGIAEKSFI